VIGSLVAVVVIALLTSATSVVAVDARLSVPGGMCSLWTVKQVSSAMKETMKVVRDDPGYCVWYSKKDHNGNISTASAGLWGGDGSDEPFIDQSRVGPRWVGEIEVAGVPVLKTKVERSGKNRDMSMDAFPDASTWMNFNAHSVIGANVETALKRLIEIAVDKLPVIAPSASPLASPGTGPGSPCDLWTTDEVAAALGGEPTSIDASARSAQTCGYRGEQAGSFTSFMAALGSGDPSGGPLVDVVHQSFPDAVDVEVAGVPAVRIPSVPLSGDAEGWTQSTLFVFPDPSTVLQLQANAPAGVDGDAALIALAQLALTRLGVVAPPSGAPTSPAASSSAAPGSSPAAAP
jgi:hypothetical protein